MKVLKFGGTSVGSVESLRNVKKIVDAIPGRAVIVVSALGGLTDKLIASAEMASHRNTIWVSEFSEIQKRHFDIIEQLVEEEKKDEVLKNISRLLGDLYHKYESISKKGNLEKIDLDEVVSFGERMSSVIVAAIVENGKRYYSPNFIKTEKWWGKDIADSKLTEKLIKEWLGNLPENEKAIVPGFISSDSTSGVITNLGRGGSDFTGALIAAALEAEVLEIWTDVDGFMTADPRIVKNALIIDHLTFTESMELCSFGAKVIYPPTIYPVFNKNIPIRILNTFNPSAPGTLVTDHPHPDDFEVKGVTAHKALSLVSIPFDMPSPRSELLQKALNCLSNRGINILTLDNSDEFDVLNFGFNASDAPAALQLLKDTFSREIPEGSVKKPKLKEGLAAVAIVGKDMKNRPRLSARIRNSLLREGIEVATYSDSSDTTLLLMIEEGKTPEALPLIHSLLF